MRAGCKGTGPTQGVIFITTAGKRSMWLSFVERHGALKLMEPAATSLLSLHSDKETKLGLELIEICTLVVQSKLFEGKHQEALPAALLCLRYTEDVHGPQSVHQAHAFLLLAEANIGLGNLALAAELLSQAEWVLLETPECRNSLLQRLNRNFGCLHAATGNLEDARFYFANDIFFATVEFGVNSTVTAGSLFLVVDVFAKMKKTVMTRSLYQEVARIWYDHLTKLLEIYKKSNSNSAMSSNTFHGSSSVLSECDLQKYSSTSQICAFESHSTNLSCLCSKLETGRLCCPEPILKQRHSGKKTYLRVCVEMSASSGTRGRLKLSDRVNQSSDQSKRAKGEQVLGAILEFLQKDISKDLAQIALVTYSLSVLRLPQDWITSK
ncbi:zinc finger MYND domain-containing protein 12 [Oryzias latipes]|uniref:zinc finger MYND domain-containing protein 12 n=1 Tax=Oryzias latipes TaxID=8090 RepID=UPI000CE163DE|nr:zinc finger MYND domain-containing protein 12 [Oryzias latipes]